jgi:hypothetical protein
VLWFGIIQWFGSIVGVFQKPKRSVGHRNGGHEDRSRPGLKLADRPRVWMNHSCYGAKQKAEEFLVGWLSRLTKNLMG